MCNNVVKDYLQQHKRLKVKDFGGKFFLFSCKAPKSVGKFYIKYKNI